MQVFRTEGAYICKIHKTKCIIMDNVPGNSTGASPQAAVTKSLIVIFGAVAGVAAYGLLR